MADTAPKTQLGRHQNPSRSFAKLLTCLLYKALTAILFLVLVPVFTSRPPDFVVLTGRSWEILHIVLVIIAVSYGLFCRRKEASRAEEKNGNYPNTGKFENAQSYVSRFLQLSSMFDDESDSGGGGGGGGSVSVNPSGSDVGSIHMAWNIQYFRNEPMLVVDEDRNGGDISARISTNPLLLPIRSLRSRVSDDLGNDLGGAMSLRSCSADNAWDGLNTGLISKRVPNGLGHLGESGVLPASISRSGANRESIPKRAPCGGSKRPRNGRVYDIGNPEQETNVKNRVVLPSPIPWQSRSERMETREGVDSAGNTFKADDLVVSGSVGPQFSRSLSTTSSMPDPHPLLSPAPSLSLPKEVSPPSSASSMSLEATVVANSVKKKSSSHKSHTPALPPPPLPLITTFELPSEKPSSVSPRNSQSCVYKDVSRNHPKSVRTIRASAERIQRNVSGKDLGESFFDGVLENEERKQELFEKMIIKLEDEETQCEDIDAMEAEDPEVLKNGEVSPIEDFISNSSKYVGPDVDKKADEFIAKFREQIRLQRMDSIKRSSAKTSNNPTR